MDQLFFHFVQYKLIVQYFWICFMCFSCLVHQFIRNNNLSENQTINKIIIMSIYSGFATRNQQETYDQTVCDILFVMQKRILKFYNNMETDQDKFWAIFSQLYHQVLVLEKNKYLQPKSSFYVSEIYEYLKEKKQERNRDPEEDLKKFERSIVNKLKKQEQIKIKEVQINNFIRRSSFSFGKIKKQLDLTKNINTSVQSGTRKLDGTNETFDSKIELKGLNPQDRNRNRTKRIFSSNGKRNANSLQQDGFQNLNDLKIKVCGNSAAHEIVKQYLQKTNKNYLRGYRKRRIRQQLVSSKTSDIRVCSKRKASR